MTIATSVRKAGPYVGNGAQTVFAFAFKVFLTSDVVVTRALSSGTEVPLTLGADYTVALNADQNATPGGTITYPISGTPLASPETLTITSTVPQTQATSLPQGGSYSAQVIENAFDKVTILAQQIWEKLTRAIRQPVSDATAISELPVAANRANKVLGFDATGNVPTMFSAASAVTGSDSVNFLQGGNGAVSRLAQDKLRERVSLKDFGAKGDGVTDDSAALSLAIIYCVSVGAELFIPRGTYIIASAITATGMCSIRGEGNGSILKWTGTAGGIPLTFSISVQYAALHYKDFVIDSATGNRSATALKVVLAAAPASFFNFVFEGLVLSNCSSYGLIFDNTINNTNGIFCGTVRNCTINNGMQGILIGDNVRIENNTFSSVSTIVGNTIIGVKASQVVGAAELVIRGNNFTSGGGSIELTSCTQARILDNQCEYLPTFTYVAGNNGLVYLTNCVDCTIQNNNLNPNHDNSVNNTPSYALVLNGATCMGNQVRGNSFCRGQSTKHILFSGGAYGNIIGLNAYTPNQLLLFDLTTPMTYPQIGIPMDASANLAGTWVLDNVNGASRITLLLDEDGTAHLYGQIKSGGSGTLFTMPTPVVSYMQTCMTCGLNAAGARINSSFCVLSILDGAGQVVSANILPDATHAMLDGFTCRYYLTR